MDWKKIGKALLFPHIAFLLVLLPVATVLLVYSMAFVGEESAVSYISYVLAAYTLTIWCVRVPELLRFFKKFKDENKYARRWLTDTHLRVNVSLYGALFWNADGNAELEKFDRFVSKIEYGDEEVLPILKAMSATKDWIWNDHVEEKVWRDRGWEPILRKPIEDDIRGIYNKMFDLEMKLAKCNLRPDIRDVVQNSAKAHRLLVMWESTKSDPIIPHEQIATVWEQWFEEYAEIWRAENKEGELADIADFVAYQCQRLRDHKTYTEF